MLGIPLRALMGKEAEVEGETSEDTIRDLGAYCLLYLTRPDQGEAVEAAGKE